MQVSKDATVSNDDVTVICHLPVQVTIAISLVLQYKCHTETYKGFIYHKQTIIISITLEFPLLQYSYV